MFKCRLQLVTLLWGWLVWYLNSTFKGFIHRSKHPELCYLCYSGIAVSHALLTENLDKVQCPIMHGIYPDVSSVTESTPEFLISLSLQPQSHPQFKQCAFSRKGWPVPHPNPMVTMFLDRMQYISTSKLYPSPDTYTRGSTVLDFSFLLSL